MNKVDANDFDQFSQNYRRILDHAVKFSGDNSEYFSDYKARVVGEMVGPDFSGKILDFGCGVGVMALLLKKRLPAACIHGYDISSESIAMIPPELTVQGHFSHDLTTLDENYKIVVMANVLHHIPRDQRQHTISEIARRLLVGGKLIIFEHNPWNPVTRWVVCRCAFDKDAVLLRPKEACGYLLDANLQLERHGYILFFPNFLSTLRRFEPLFSRLPVGAQYVIAGEKCAT